MLLKFLIELHHCIKTKDLHKRLFAIARLVNIIQCESSLIVKARVMRLDLRRILSNIKIVQRDRRSFAQELNLKDRNFVS